MSVHITAAVWKCTDPELKGSRLLVLLSIADQANDGGWAWPAVKKNEKGSIVTRTKLGRKTVQRAVTELESLGVLEVYERRGTSNLYRVLLGADLEIDAPERVRHSDTPRGASPDTPPVHQDDAGGASVSTPGVRHGDALTVKNLPATREENLGECHRSGCDRGHGHEGPHRDPWWEELVDLFGYTPRNAEATLFGKIAQHARTVEVDASEIKERAAVYVSVFPDAALTPAAFLKHFDYLGGRLARASRAERRAFGQSMEREQRRRMGLEKPKVEALSSGGDDDE